MPDKYRDPDKETVLLIINHVALMIAKASAEKDEVAIADIVSIACHLYENKEFLLQEAGMAAPVAAKQDLDIQIICDKIDKIREYAWNGDTDPKNGLNLAEAAAPFFREYGVKIKNILKGTA